MSHISNGTRLVGTVLLGMALGWLTLQAPLTAQSSEHGELVWDDLIALPEGTRVRLALADGSAAEGSVVAVGDESLVIRDVATGPSGVRATGGSSRDGLTFHRSSITSASVLRRPRAASDLRAASFDQLAMLVRPGDRVTVTNGAGVRLSGTVTRLSSALLSLQAQGRAHDLREADVVAVRQRRSDSLANGAAWGLGIGAAMGLAACGSCHLGPGLAMAGVYGGIGAGIGVGIDALIRGQVVVYQRQRTGPRVSVVPQLTKSHKAIALSVGF
jgi:hypothetical protein